VIKYPSDEIQNADPDPRGRPLLPLSLPPRSRLRLFGRLSLVPSRSPPFRPRRLDRRLDDSDGKTEEETYATLGPHLRTTPTTVRSSCVSFSSRTEDLVVRIVSVSIILRFGVFVNGDDDSIRRIVDGIRLFDWKDVSRAKLRIGPFVMWVV